MRSLPKASSCCERDRAMDRPTALLSECGSLSGPKCVPEKLQRFTAGYPTYCFLLLVLGKKPVGTEEDPSGTLTPFTTKDDGSFVFNPLNTASTQRVEINTATAGSTCTDAFVNARPNFPLLSLLPDTGAGSSVAASFASFTAAAQLLPEQSPLPWPSANSSSPPPHPAVSTTAIENQLQKLYRSLGVDLSTSVVTDAATALHPLKLMAKNASPGLRSAGTAVMVSEFQLGVMLGLGTEFLYATVKAVDAQYTLARATCAAALAVTLTTSFSDTATINLADQPTVRTILLETANRLLPPAVIAVSSNLSRHASETAGAVASMAGVLSIVKLNAVDSFLEPSTNFNIYVAVENMAKLVFVQGQAESMNQDSYSTKYQTVVTNAAAQFDIPSRESSTVSVFNQSNCVDTITGVPMQYALHVLAVPSSELVVNPIGILAQGFYDYLARKSVMSYSTDLLKISYAAVGLDMDTYQNTIAPSSDVWNFLEGILRLTAAAVADYMQVDSASAKQTISLSRQELRLTAAAVADYMQVDSASAKQTIDLSRQNLRLTAAAVADYMQVDSASAKQTIDLSRQDVIINLYMKVHKMDSVLFRHTSSGARLSDQQMINFGVVVPGVRARLLQEQLLVDGDAQLSTEHPLEAAASSTRAHLRPEQLLVDGDAQLSTGHPLEAATSSTKAHLLPEQLLGDGDAQLSTGHPLEAAASSAKALLRQGQHLSDADSNSNSNLHRRLNEWRMNIDHPDFDYTVSLPNKVKSLSPAPNYNATQVLMNITKTAYVIQISFYPRSLEALNASTAEMLRLQQEFSAANIDRMIEDEEDLIPIDGSCNATGGCYVVAEKEDVAANIGMIVGIVMGCVVGIPLCLGVIWCLYRCCQEKRTSATVQATYKDNPMYSTQNNVSAHNGSYNHPSDGGKKYSHQAANQGQPVANQAKHNLQRVHEPHPGGSVGNGSQPYPSSPYASSPHAMSVPNQEELNRQNYSGAQYGSARVHNPYGQLQPQRSYASASQAASNRANGSTASPLARQGWNQSRQGSHLSSYSAGGAPPDHVWSSLNNSAGPLVNLGGQQASATNHVTDYPLYAAPNRSQEPLQGVVGSLYVSPSSWANSSLPANHHSHGNGHLNASLGPHGGGGASSLLNSSLPMSTRGSIAGLNSSLPMSTRGSVAGLNSSLPMSTRGSTAGLNSSLPTRGSTASSQGGANFNSSLGGYGSARGSQGGANLNSSVGGYGSNLKRGYSGFELVSASSGSLSQSLQPNLNQDSHAPPSRLRY
eukprot:gene30072-35041_t